MSKPTKKITDKALQEGIKAGILEEFVVNGEVKYRLSTLGKHVSKHAKSELSQRN